MTPDSLFAFLLACTVIELTPGPNMMYLALLSSVQGRRAGFSLVAGIALGLLVIGLVAAYGAAVVVAGNPVLYHGLRWAGVAYMLWLAWESWPRTHTKPDIAEGFDARYFRRGFITNVLNPKAAIFYITVFPSFVGAAGDTLRQTLLMTFVYVLVATAIHAAIAVLGSTLTPYLQGTEKARRIQIGFSFLLLLIAVWFAWSTHEMPSSF